MVRVEKAKISKWIKQQYLILHYWGLYLPENIAGLQALIEYVGE